MLPSCALFSKFSSIGVLVLAALLLLLAASPARAQATFATITGVVTDSTSARIAGVEVAARQVETNYRYTVKSNETGAYNLPELREGHYVLTARAQGFKEYSASDITLAARDVRRIDIQLEVGDVSSTIEVSAGGGSLIETETARVADMKTSEVMQDLPTNPAQPDLGRVQHLYQRRKHDPLCRQPHRAGSLHAGWHQFWQRHRRGVLARGWFYGKLPGDAGRLGQ